MIPVEASEMEAFTPPALANLPTPPEFLLRPATERELRQYQYAVRCEGLQHHDKETLRAEMLRALEALWLPEAFETNAARLRSYWALTDQGGEPDPAETEAVERLAGDVTRAWRPLAVMLADNMRFAEETLRIVASMFVSGWNHVAVPYGREAGRVPLARIDALDDWLRQTETDARQNGIEGVAQPGTAFIQLCNACYRRMGLTKDQEKNSSSPPSSPPAPTCSTTRSSRRTAGASSKASASSSSSPER